MDRLVLDIEVVANKAKAMTGLIRSLEEENRRLHNMVDTLTEQLEKMQIKLADATDYETYNYLLNAHQELLGVWRQVDLFMDLIQADIEAKERCILNDERLIALISAYRQIRPRVAGS